MNKIIHGVVLLSFGVACAFQWSMLSLIANVIPHLLQGRNAPGFTRFCFGLEPVLFILPCLATAYCLFIWIRPAKPGDNWYGFFATTMTITVLLMFPVTIAVVLPLIAALEHPGG